MFPYEVWRYHHESLYLLTTYNGAVLANMSFFSTQRLLDDIDNQVSTQLWRQLALRAVYYVCTALYISNL